MTLNDLAINETGIITDIRLDGNMVRRFADMGIIKGASVTKLRFAPFGSPVEFFVSGCRIAIRKNDAEKIFVEKVAKKYENRTCR